MTQTASGCFRQQKWYNMNIFPIVPIVTIVEADKYNTRSFTFRWLFFTFWTLDSFQFELSFNIDTHWGVGFTFLLPYLRGVVAIPCPEKIERWVHKNLSRKIKKTDGN